MTNPMSWTERRKLALSIADATPGYDRVPAPERTWSWPTFDKKAPPQPYLKTFMGKQPQRPMSRQERRQRDREEERPPVLSAALENELRFKGDGGIYMRRVNGRPSYIVGAIECFREPTRMKSIRLSEAFRKIGVPV
jgi:hypothetical protein